MPEDVGHCFVTWATKFDSYVKYCTNKHIQHLILLFENLSREPNLTIDIVSQTINNGG